MKLLVLGGTRFVGRHLVEAALARGHEVTLFNRGKHGAELFPGVERLRGDRDGDLAALRGRRWDTVIDTCGYFPRVVTASAELLAEAAGLYVFISSISVYAEVSKAGLDEGDAVGTLEDETVEEVNGETYGPLKALCERAAEEAMPGRVLSIRPGLIVGPYDPTDRFTYWSWRVLQGGEVLAPGEAEGAVQVIDARDLAAWTVGMAEQGQTGVFNATGPDYRLTMQALLECCNGVSGGHARFTWVDEAFLKEREVGAFVEMPLWLPAEARGLAAIDCRRAFRAGLRFRPLEHTVRDTLVWDKSRNAAGHDAKAAGITRERERELLAAWHAQRK